MRGRLICYPRENPKIKQRRDPEDQVKDKRAKKFREHYLPVAHRHSRERLDRAELKFFGKQPHGDEGKNQNEREPEENGIEERFLDCVLHLALVHERDLEIKIDPADDQKKDHHDVRNRGIEIAAHFAQEQGVKLTHRSLSDLSLDSNQIRMGQLDENVLERSPALSEFTHRPMTFHSEAENLFAKVRTGFDP